jgi:hypothetical protein
MMPKPRPSTQFATAHAAAQRWPRRTDQPSIFTAFVRGQGTETPDADLFHDAWHGLRALLAKELKRRGLWLSSPAYLGVCGGERWDAEETPGALGELVADAYTFVFVDRMQSLKRQLEDKPDIDGLVLLNVRHFLHERQREHDPFGFRIFELLQAAVGEAVAAGNLYLLAGSRKVRNDTLLGFDPAAEPPPPATAPDLSAIVARWNDQLMPDLVTARTRQQAAVLQQLRALVLELPRHGIEVFRFKDLLDPLKIDARARWATLLEEVSGSLDPAPDAAPSFESLTRHVSASIARIKEPRTRTQLSTLWHYLRRRHGGDPDTGTGQERESELTMTLETSSPSYRQLGRRLKLPRERLPALFSLLRQLVPR